MFQLNVSMKAVNIMRIMIINHFPLEGSGSGTYTKSVAAGLSRMGHDVKVIFPEHEEKKYDEFLSRAILFNNGSNSNYEIEFNFPCFITHPKSNIKFSELNNEQMWKYIDTFTKIVKEEVINFEPDIIHCQHIWISSYIASKTGVPYIITAHGTEVEAFERNPQYHCFALEGAANAEKIITISKHIDKKVKEFFKVKDRNREILKNSYNEEIFKPMKLNKEYILKKFGINTIPRYIVSYAGRLTHIKGVDILLKSAKIYEDILDGDVVTLIAGNGESYEYLRNLRDNLELKGIFFLGHLSQELLADLFNISAVNVVPSRFEGFGLVAVEAMACRTSVVCTNQGGLPDFVKDDVGKLVEADDVQAFAQAIINELTRSDRKRRRIAAYKYAAYNFSSRQIMGEVERVLNQAVGNSSEVSTSA